jgi:hypothetical protein
VDFVVLVANVAVLFLTVLLLGCAISFLLSVFMRLGLILAAGVCDAVRFLRPLGANSIWMTGSLLSIFMFLCGIGYGVFQH